MCHTKMIVGLAAALLSVSSWAYVLAESQGETEQKMVLLRKTTDGGEVVCLRGPNIAPSVVKGIWGDKADAFAAVYECWIEWHTHDGAAIRLWSSMFGVSKVQMQGGRIVEAKAGPLQALQPQGMSVLDIEVIPRTPADQTAPAAIVLAVRHSFGGIGLLRITQPGSEVGWWDGGFNPWTVYDTPVPTDPSSVELSLSPQGLCRAEVRSGDLHTLFEQTRGKWEFAVVKQWR